MVRVWRALESMSEMRAKDGVEIWEEEGSCLPLDPLYTLYRGHRGRSRDGIRVACWIIGQEDGNILGPPWLPCQASYILLLGLVLYEPRPRKSQDETKPIPKASMRKNKVKTSK